VRFISGLMAHRVPLSLPNLASTPTRLCCTSARLWRNRSVG
jgi:hypothetical protein